MTRPLRERIREIAAHGPVKAALDLTLRAANRLVVLKILNGVVLLRANPANLVCPMPYRAGWVEARLLRRLASRGNHELSERFVDEALNRGDECLGVFEGDELVAYGWYARHPTPIDPPNLILHFSDRLVYMYKGFTQRAHRGKHLHALGASLALQHYLSRGVQGMVAYVEANNFASIHSLSRMGYVKFGTLYVLGLRDRYVTASSGEGDLYGFHLEHWEGAPLPTPTLSRR